MTGIRDPEALRDVPGVEFREQERVVDRAEYEAVAEGAEDQSGLVVVGVRDRDGRVLLVDSEHVDGWTLPNGPVGVDEDWAIAADRWSEQALGTPIDVGAPELVIRTVTRPESGDGELVGYSVAFGASPLRGMEGNEMGPDNQSRPSSEGGEGAAGPGNFAERSDVEWFDKAPDDAAPGYEALIRFFLD
ncbi:NUDIX hydrolase [Halosimplex sp. J119]